MTDWQVVEGHRSRASCSPGAQVMVRPHPQVLSLLRGHSGDKPTGVPRPPVSMEMKRGAGRGSASHLYGQRLPVSEESALAFTAIAREPAVACPTRTPTTPPLPHLPFALPFLFLCRLLRSQRECEGGQHVRPSLPWQRWPCEACWEQW